MTRDPKTTPPTTLCVDNTMYKKHFSFSGIFLHFSSGRGSLLALSAAWHAGGSRAYDGASVGPGRAPLGGALSVQSREIWQVIAGRPSAQLEPSNPTVKLPIFSPYCCLLLFLKYRSSPQKLGSSHGTTAALQTFPFVTATNGAAGCVYDV